MSLDGPRLCHFPLSSFNATKDMHIIIAYIDNANIKVTHWTKWQNIWELYS